MSQAIAKITLFCWGFVSIFGGVLIVARALPPKSLPLVSLIAGATAASVIGLRIFCVCRARGGLGRLGAGIFSSLRSGLLRWSLARGRDFFRRTFKTISPAMAGLPPKCWSLVFGWLSSLHFSAGL